MYILQHQTWVIQSTPKWWTPIIKYVLKTTTLVMSCVNQHTLNFKHPCCIWGLLEVPQTLTASAYSFLVESHGQGTIFWSTASRAKFLNRSQICMRDRSGDIIWWLRLFQQGLWRSLFWREPRRSRGIICQAIILKYLKIIPVVERNRKMTTV